MIMNLLKMLKRKFNEGRYVRLDTIEFGMSEVAVTERRVDAVHGIGIGIDPIDSSRFTKRRNAAHADEIKRDVDQLYYAMIVRKLEESGLF